MTREKTHSRIQKEQYATYGDRDMNIIHLTDDQIEYAKEIGEVIREDKENAGFQDKGGHAQKNPELSNLMGFLAETVFADTHGFERPQLIEGDIDDGKDYGNIEVKASATDDLIMFMDRDYKDVDYIVSYRVPTKLVEYLLGEREQRPEHKDYVVERLIITPEMFDQHHEIKDYGYGKRKALPVKEFYPACPKCDKTPLRHRVDDGVEVYCGRGCGFESNDPSHIRIE